MMKLRTPINSQRVRKQLFVYFHGGNTYCTDLTCILLYKYYIYIPRQDSVVGATGSTHDECIRSVSKCDLEDNSGRLSSTGIQAQIRLLIPRPGGERTSPEKIGLL